MAAENRAYRPREEARDPEEARQEREQQQPEQPLSRLFSELARDASDLVRKEVELARTEVAEKVGQATSGVSRLAMGGGIAFAGLLFVLLAITYALSEVVAPWLAALIVGGVTLAIGAALLLAGRNKLKAEKLQPQRTLETLREDGRWARQQLGR